MNMSIITVCYNSEATVERTLKSVLAQTINDFEYIIVDGMSEDGTMRIVRSYLDRFLEKGIACKVISEKDGGIYDAMNKGIHKAEGRIIGIINSDDWYEKDVVEKVTNYYRKEPFDILCGDIYIWKNGKIFMRKKARQRRFKSSRDFNHPGMFVSRDCYSKYGVYRCQVFYADYDFYLRVSRENANIRFCHELFSNFSLGGISNKKELGQLLMRVSERYRIYRDNHFSRFYLLECIFQEVTKFILA